MIPVLIGDDADARGLALAGVDGYVCTTREQVEDFLSALLDAPSPGPSPSLRSGSGPPSPRGAGRGQGEGFVILFSASAALLIADRIAAWRRDGSGPPFVVLPSAQR